MSFIPERRRIPCATGCGQLAEWRVYNRRTTTEHYYCATCVPPEGTPRIKRLEHQPMGWVTDVDGGCCIQVFIRGEGALQDALGRRVPEPTIGAEPMADRLEDDGVDRSDWSEEAKEYERLVRDHYPNLSDDVARRMLKLEQALGLETLVPVVEESRAHLKEIEGRAREAWIKDDVVGAIGNLLDTEERMKSDAELIETWFTYHAPKDDQPQRYEAIRAAGKELAKTILACCPSSADRTAALRKVREAVFTANAAIACGEA